VSKGYDTAKTSQQEDDLGRWRFAAEIADVIRSTDKSWSARIGIFGKWGEGKTTVLHFLEKMLEPDGNIIIRFNPWAARDLEELWIEFTDRLLEGLSDHDLIVETGFKTQLRKTKKALDKSGLGDALEVTADVFGRGKIVGSTLSIMDKWLKPDGDQVKKIREKLGEKHRLIVFVDDLDRAEPELLPKLFLSLREILDLPGFTFVLAFDNEIIEHGLRAINDAWGDGKSFLDKILDFKFYLPAVSKAGKRLLLNKELDRHCSFVPGNSFQSIEHLLPDNPRKVKALVRAIAALKPQVSRHDEEELVWTDIWLAQLIRLESYEFFDRLLQCDLYRMIGQGYRITTELQKRSGKVDSDNKEITDILDGAGVSQDSQRKRILTLLAATRQLASFAVQYNFRFAGTPDAVTWREFRELCKSWRLDQTSELISAWIGKHSKAYSFTRSDVEEDLFQTVLNAEHEKAAAAAESISLEEQEDHLKEAAVLLRMMEQFLRLPGCLTPQRFRGLHDKILHYIEFRRNPGDQNLRILEREMLLSLLGDVADADAPDFLSVLKPWDYRRLSADPEKPHGTKLQDDCVVLLEPKVERAFIASLQLPESIRRLANFEQFRSFIWIFLSDERLPWDRLTKNAVFSLIERGNRDRVSFQKLIDLLRLLRQAGAANSMMSKAGARVVVSDRQFTAAIWQVVISKTIQYRMQDMVMGYRAVLIDLGANETDLPLSPELAERYTSATSQKDVLRQEEEPEVSDERALQSDDDQQRHDGS
jgi:hypothetical protein